MTFKMYNEYPYDDEAYGLYVSHRKPTLIISASTSKYSPTNSIVLNMKARDVDLSALAARINVDTKGTIRRRLIMHKHKKRLIMNAIYNSVEGTTITDAIHSSIGTLKKWTEMVKNPS